MATARQDVLDVLRAETRPGGRLKSGTALVAQAMDQESRAKLLIEQDPTMAARILGCAIDSVILVDGNARTEARQEMHRLSRMVRAAHPHLACD